MTVQSGLSRMICGLILFGVFGALAAAIGAQEYRRSGAPLVASVAEAVARVEAGETLPNVRLTDLQLVCDSLQLARKRAYVGAFGGDAGEAGPTVLVELGGDDGCNDGPAGLVGELERPPLPVLVDLGLTDDPHIALLRPHNSDLVGLLVLVALSLVGVALVGSGLRQRRAGREQLRRLVDDPPAELAAELAPGSPFRQAADGRWLLPGPLRPSDEWVRRQRRRGAGAFVCAVVLLGAAAWTAIVTVRDALGTRAVWSSGIPASDVQVDGTSRTRLLVFEDADLSVAYTDGAGHRHHGRVSRMGLGKLDDGAAPVVHVAVDDPERFALSWQVDGVLGELTLHLVFVLMLGGFALALVAIVRKGRRELVWTLETLKASPEEVVLPVLHITQGMVNGEHATTTYGLRIPDGDTFELTLPRDEYPLFLAIDQSCALGLRRPGDRSRAVVVREDMTPLAAASGEAERVRLRWREGQRQPGKQTLDEFIHSKFSGSRVRE